MDDLVKSVVALIDETLGELQELRKSNRFSASEISLEGPGSDLMGKPTNGSLGKEEDEEDDEDEDEEEGEAEKSDKEDEKKEDKKDKDDEKADKDHKHDISCTMKNEAPGAATLQRSEEIKKSLEASETLIKSYIDEKVGALESKLAGILSLVQKIGDAPVAPRGATYRDIKPLAKSEEPQTLTKSMVTEKLFELQKSGQQVSSLDITRVEVGSSEDLQSVVKKYKLI